MQNSTHVSKRLKTLLPLFLKSRIKKPEEESDALDALEEELKGEKEETHDESDVEVDPKEINAKQEEAEDDERRRCRAGKTRKKPKLPVTLL
ncbi:MAG: hypothetical protein ACLU45_01870 [Dialister invisus]|uniref:hypothetical protein n=1 Tax=Dialister invisus TaxID=218538 RepID=UPI003999EB57